MLIRSLRPVAHIAGFATLLSTAAVTCQLMTPQVLKYLIDDVILAGATGRLPEVTALLAGLAAGGFALNAGGSTLFAHVTETALVEIRTGLARHLRRLPYYRVRDRPPGEIVAHFTGDATALASACGSIASEGLPSVLRLATATVIISHAYPYGFLLVAGTATLFAGLAVVVQGRLGAAADEKHRCNAEITTSLMESVSASRDITALDAADADVKHLRSKFKEATRPEVMLSAFTQMVRFNSVVYWVLVAGVYRLGGALVIDGTLTLGSLSALLAYLAMIQQPAAVLVALIVEGRVVRTAARRLGDFLEIGPESQQCVAYRPANGRAEQLEFRGVSHRYREGRWALRDLSFRIGAGTTAIIGHNGAGKSTVLQLVIRLFEPDRGEILLDGRNIREYEPGSLRRASGVVFQDPYLFAGTIEDNITFGRTDVPHAEVEQAARDACVHDIITHLPNGYRTIVGNGIGGLSVGEVHRVALSRAFVRKGAIVLLDEATAPLDGASELALRRSLMERIAREPRIALLVTHRMSVARECDRIMVLDEGRLAGIGTHQDLEASCTRYRELVEFEEEARTAKPPRQGGIRGPERR